MFSDLDADQAAVFVEVEDDVGEGGWAVEAGVLPERDGILDGVDACFAALGVGVAGVGIDCDFGIDAERLAGVEPVAQLLVAGAVTSHALAVAVDHHEGTQAHIA